MRGCLRKMIVTMFKTRGYGLNCGALDNILVFVQHFRHSAEVDEKADKAEKADKVDKTEDAIDFVLDLLQQESLNSSIVDAESIQRVISPLLRCVEESTPTASYLVFIDAFVVPKYRYDAVTKQFIIVDPPPVHGDPSSKIGLYRERFMLLQQRVSRSDFFSRLTFDTETSQFNNYEISSIQSLIFQLGRKWVMGLISQLEDGHFYLEDMSASVEIDLSKAISFFSYGLANKSYLCSDCFSLTTSQYKITTGFFTENIIILAEGEMQNGIFQVTTCGFPPLEDRDKTLKTHSGYDFFGVGMLTKEEMTRLAALERRAVNDTFVILSDIWLDDEEVLLKLETVLDGFENMEIVPSLFVFMGNFCSRPCNVSFSSLRQQFGKLGRMIAKHPRLKENSRFLFIPGPDDAGPSNVLPRCGLPNYLTKELRDVIPDAKFLSNPCRVKFYNQEIVFFFRQDLLYRMRRSCLITPSSEGADDPFQHLVFTIINQSHLCPLPLMVQPIIWNYDHCLRLYPTPHAIVLGDKSEQKVCKFGETTCFNPGSFSTDSTFIAYRPSTQEVKLSAL